MQKLKILIVVFWFVMSCGFLSILNLNYVKADNHDIYFVEGTFKLEKDEEEDWSKVSCKYKTAKDFTLEQGYYMYVKCYIFTDDTLGGVSWWGKQSMTTEDEFTIFCKVDGTDWECGGIILDYYNILTEGEEGEANNWKQDNVWEEAIEAGGSYSFTAGMFNPYYDSELEFENNVYLNPPPPPNEDWGVEVFPTILQTDPDESNDLVVTLDVPLEFVEFPDIVIESVATEPGFGWTYQTTVIHLELGSPANINDIFKSIGTINKNISNLDDNKFDKNPEQRKNAFYEILIENVKGDAVQQLINAEEYDDAINELKDVYKKLDGDTSPSDWIIQSTEKTELQKIINHTIKTLEMWYS